MSTTVINRTPGLKTAISARLIEPDVLSKSESVLLLGAFLTLVASMLSFITL